MLLEYILPYMLFNSNGFLQIGQKSIFSKQISHTFVIQFLQWITFKLFVYSFSKHIIQLLSSSFIVFLKCLIDSSIWIIDIPVSLFLYVIMKSNFFPVSSKQLYISSLQNANINNFLLSLLLSTKSPLD